MIQDDTNSSDSISITSQSSTALLALLVKVWDLFGIFDNTHYIYALDKQIP